MKQWRNNQRLYKRRDPSYSIARVARRRNGGNDQQQYDNRRSVVSKYSGIIESVMMAAKLGIRRNGDNVAYQWRGI